MERAIGVIDSGVGGLTVAQELMRQLPKEKLIYLGDTQRCPYGSRTEEEVQQFTWQMVDFLLTKNIKMLVVACNTATAFTLPELQKKLSIPVVGVIQPGARTAIKMTANNRIGVIGTEGTIQSRAYEQALNTIKTHIYIESLACPQLVPMVEQGMLSGYKAEQIVRESLAPLLMKNNIDTLILGCTHYPLIKDTIQKVIGQEVTIVSSSEETARETSTILDVHGLLYQGEREAKHAFYTTGNLEMFTTIANGIFNQEVGNVPVVDCEKIVIH